MKRAAGRPARPIHENAPFRDFAARLRELRKAASLTLRKLSERSGYSTGWLSEAESGERLPSLEGALAFASACGADPQAWTAWWLEAANRRDTAPPQAHSDSAAELLRARSLLDDMQRRLDAAERLLAETSRRLEEALRQREEAERLKELALSRPAEARHHFAALEQHELQGQLAAPAPEGLGALAPLLTVTAEARDDTLGRRVTGQPVTVAIIDAHPVVTEGVASWIGSDPGQRVRLVQAARDLTEFRATPRPTADVVILDLELSGELVTTQIPGLVAAGYRVVAFSGHSDPAIVMEALDNGAHAYVSKEEGRDHLVEAVLAAAADRPYITRSQARAMLADQRPARPALSGQERQALRLWFQGMTKASVGRRMSISENTVRQYISRARAKYAATGREAPSKDALLARAIEDSVIRPGEIMPYQSFARAVIGLSHPGASAIEWYGPRDCRLKSSWYRRNEALPVQGGPLWTVLRQQDQPGCQPSAASTRVCPRSRTARSVLTQDCRSEATLS